MSNEPLDISIAISLSVPDIELSASNTGKNINMQVEKRTDYHENYTGQYVVDPSIYYQQRLETEDKVMLHDVLVNAVSVAEVTNPQGGKTITIGGN